LDGLPLAIELAAARVGSVGAQALLEATTDRLRLLTGGHGMQERHRSLRAVLDWSHDLLAEPEQRLLRRLGVFAGGFDLAAAVSVAGDDGDPAEVIDARGQLVDKSLIERQPAGAGGAAWRLLETVRSYALDRLERSGEAADIRARHRSWAASVVGDLANRLDDDASWADEFDLVVDDLRAALEAAPVGPDQMTYQLARATGLVAFARGLLVESERHLRVAAAHATTSVDAATALETAAHVATTDVRYASAVRLLVDAGDAVGDADDGLRATCLAQAVILPRRYTGGFDETVPIQRLRGLLDDVRRLAPPTDPLASAWRVQAEAWMASEFNNDADLALAEAALLDARSADEPTLICVATDAVSAALLNTGRYREAYRVDRARLDVIRRMRAHDPHAAEEIDDAIETAGHAGCAAGELRDSLAAQEAALETHDVRRRPVRCAGKFALSLALTGRFDEASTTAEEMWSAWLAAGSPFAGWMGPSMLGAALAHGLCRYDAAYEEWRRRAASLFPDGNLWEYRNTGTVAAFTVARVALNNGDLEEAGVVTSRYLDHPPPIPPGALSYFDAYPRALAADIAAAAGSSDASALIDGAAQVAAENRWAAACLARARGRLSGDQDLIQRAADAFADIDARFEEACTRLLVPTCEAEARRLFEALGCPPPA
jgi:hypothetical protein